MSVITSSRAHRRARRTVCFAAVLLNLAGCASLGAPPQPRAVDATGLVRQDDGTLAWRTPRWTPPRRLRIDAEAVAFAPGVAIEPAQAQVLRETLVHDLGLEAQAAGLELAGPQEAGVPRVRAVITGVTLAQPLLNAAATALLVGAVSRGGLEVELELVAPQQERLAALVFSGRAGLLNVVDGLSPTGHAQQQARDAARRFARLLTAAEGGGDVVARARE